jgi:SAM-dependent methyltransferase
VSDAVRCSYDDLPYNSNFFVMTHPDRLATVAVLHGLTPPPVETCRVFEIGCAGGGNLLPMAQALPGARFVGIDLSPRQVADGRAIVEELGFDNVDLRAMSLMDVDDDFGQFDYIICHGVYSWVPPEARDKILSICARNLSPNGVAYVSYNCYPGWHLRGMVREMLLYHTRDFPDPRTSVRQARAFLDFLLKSSLQPDRVYAQMLKHEADLLDQAPDTYLFHEHLESENHPLYFREFIEGATAAGLQYLGPARYSALDQNLKPEVKHIIDQLGKDRISREQYLDFVQNRTFRHSLLCHAELTVPEGPRADAVRSLHVVAQAKPQSPSPDLSPGAAEEFVSPFGDRLSTNRPLVKAALTHLFEIWPLSETFDGLWAEVDARLGGSDGDPNALAEVLLRLHMSNLVALHVFEPRFTLEPCQRPIASPVARLQAEGDTRVVSLRSHNVDLDEFDGLVLRLLDGTRDRTAIVSGLADWVADGTFEVRKGDRPLDDPALVRSVLDEALEPALRRLAGQALIVGDGATVA